MAFWMRPHGRGSKMPGEGKTADPIGRRPYGAMRELNPDERRHWQRTTIARPPRRYGWDARLQFWLEDLVFGKARTLPKFKARELIARSPYQSWEQAACLIIGKIRDRSARAMRLYENLIEIRAEQDNELWHVLLLEELVAASDVRENPVRFRLIPQLLAFAIYQEFWLLRVVNPARSYRLNADIEDHAEHEYAALIAEHPEWEDVPFNSVVASGYTAYESLADLFRQIGSDEGVHKEMSLARISRAGKSC
jgi:ubiquinol oxidase